MRQGLIGLGAMASQVLGSEFGAAGDAVVTLSGSRSSIENMWVRVSLKSSGGVGVRVTCTGSNENSRLTNIFCENQTEGAIAFGIGDNTSLDVAEVAMIGCDSVGNSAVGSIHMQVGDGGAGNVLDTTNIGGNSQNNNYGVVMAGGALVSRGLNFQSSGTADIFLHQPGVGNISFDGGRSENAVRFLISSSFSSVSYATVKVANYTVVALQNTDGQGVQIGWLATFDNVAIFGANAPQYFFLRGGGVDNDNPAILTARSCVSDHPFPFQTSWSRPGKIIRSSGIRFSGDSAFQLWSRNTTSDTWVRRMNVTSTAPFTINPFFYEAIDINLPGKDTGIVVNTPVIVPGAVGQTITICFQQNGVGHSAFTWPALCAWSGGTAPAKAPKNGTTSRNRQSCTFRYNGRYWEQIGPVTNVLPPAVAATPITDNFRTGNPFWLNQPDTHPVPTPTTPRWEHVPGGGSLGIQQVGGVNMCVTPCLGYFGDREGDDVNGLFGPGAAAVIETGMATQPTGISAEFTWQKSEGIICRYRDDQNFVIFVVFVGLFTVDASGPKLYTAITGRGFSHGTQLTLNLGDYVLTDRPPIAAGSKHTLLVKCTATDFAVSLDGAAPHHFESSDQANFPNFLDFTKHGIFSSHRLATFTNFMVS